MKTVDWEKIETVFSAALAVDEQQRDRYLQEVCENDDMLFNEVSSLIRAFQANSTFIDSPCRDLGLKAYGADSEPIERGEMVGNFRIERLVGEGGMGRVYLASDTRLGREVALKFLSDDPFLDNDWAERQALKEAKASASLVHPNICSVYAVEQIDDHRVIVMEYVKGESLAEFLRSGRRLTGDEFFTIAKQITDAIASAHERDVVHCDIKPGNIMLDAEGQIKILDFGVAKILHRRNVANGVEEFLSRASQEGLIEGTVAYMSPEQLKGEDLDRRTDIFSLGTVLFELATGINPFAKKSDAETISEILSPESPLDSPLSNEIPAPLRPILKRCLERERKDRYQSARELLADLENPRAIARKVSTWLTAVLAVALILVVTIAGFLAFVRGREPYKMAILPFRNETSDPANDHISDGMGEGLIRKLYGSDRLRLTPYTAVTGYRGEDVDHVAAGREIGTDLVVSGTLSRREGQLIIQTNLLDVNRGIVIQSWEDEVPQNDPLSFETNMTDRLISLLGVDPQQLTEAKRRGSTTKNPEAFRQFLVGRYYWKKRDSQNLHTAIAAFQRSIELDPGYGRPYAGLADSYVLLSLVAYGTVPTRETMTKARAAARQALEINPDDAEAHTSLGIVLTKYDWNWAAAEKEFRLAIDLDPDYAAAHYWLSDVLAITGRAEESIREAKRARELDPFSPQTEMNLARTYYYAREYDKATEVLLGAGSEGKVDRKINYMLGLVHLQKGSYAEALKIFQDIAAENRLFAAAPLGYTYAKLGMKKEALAVIEELKTSAGDKPVPSEQIVFIYTALGESEKAFAHLHDAYDGRNAVLIALKVEPLFDPIRNDPRFAELLRKMSLI